MEIFSRKRKNPRLLFTATFFTRLKSKRWKLDQLSPVHWLSAVHCRPVALAVSWVSWPALGLARRLITLAESVCHSVSAFFKNRKQNKTNSSPQIFNQTFYFLLAFKAFAKEKTKVFFCRKFKVFEISEVTTFRYEFVGNV